MTITRRILNAENIGCQISDSITSTGQVVTGSGKFYGFLIKCDGTNNVTINIYDNTSAAGDKLIPTDSVFDGTIKLNALDFKPPVFFDNGLYCEITCSGSTEVKILYNTD